MNIDNTLYSRRPTNKRSEVELAIHDKPCVSVDIAVKERKHTASFLCTLNNTTKKQNRLE